MAHTNRTKKDDQRKHPALFPAGAIVGINTTAGVVKGKVSHTDAGGWIYVDWFECPSSTHLPGYLRSTNVFQTEPDNVAR